MTSRSSCRGLSGASTSCSLDAKKAWMAGTSPAMTVVGCSDFPSFRGLRERCAAREIDDCERGADALGGAVLEANHGVDVDVAFAAIDRVDNGGLFLVYDA